jgi:hypothetical protein
MQQDQGWSLPSFEKGGVYIRHLEHSLGHRKVGEKAPPKVLGRARSSFRLRGELSLAEFRTSCHLSPTPQS